jgi:cell division protein YceG involved in septum cleavage
MSWYRPPSARPRFARRSRPPPRLLAGLLAWSVQACAAPADPVWIPLPQDASLEAIAESLATHGIVPSAERFARYVREHEAPLEVEPGVYALRPGTSDRHVLARLRGRPDAIRVRVEPGVWLMELAPVLSRVLGRPLDSVLAAARDSALRARLGTTAETVEGYLAPGTYVVPIPATPLEVWRQLADTFETRWRPRGTRG